MLSYFESTSTVWLKSIGALFDVNISQLKSSKASFYFCFLLFFMDFVVIYYSFTLYALMDPRVHRLDIAQMKATGEKTSRVVSRRKDPLQTAQNIIKQ